MRGRKPSDLSALEGHSIVQFREGIKSIVTLDVYSRRLALFLNWANLTSDNFVSLARESPAKAQDLVTGYMLLQKERYRKGEISPSSISNFRKPIRLLLDMNDITSVNWKKMGKLMPSARRFALDRAPTIEEVRLMLNRSDVRLQAIVLTMVSSGIRLGAWNFLNWGHVEALYDRKKLVAAKIRVYAQEPDEYTAFMTPEAYAKLEEYVAYRKQCGEAITPQSPLIRDKWLAPSRGGNVGEIGVPKRLDSNGIKRLIEDSFWRLGFRKEKKRRHEFSIHSFRKFYKTRAEQSMKPINVETLMGHSVGVSDSYYRPLETDLLSDYLNAVPLLTISEVEEVRREAQLSQKELEGRLQHLEDLVSQIAAQKGRQVLALDRTRKSGR